MLHRRNKRKNSHLIAGVLNEWLMLHICTSIQRKLNNRRVLTQLCESWLFFPLDKPLSKSTTGYMRYVCLLKSKSKFNYCENGYAMWPKGNATVSTQVKMFLYHYSF